MEDVKTGWVRIYYIHLRLLNQVYRQYQLLTTDLFLLAKVVCTVLQRLLNLSPFLRVYENTSCTTALIIEIISVADTRHKNPPKNDVSKSSMSFSS